MGSYLEIDGRETNSKWISSILIDAIRELDSRIRKNKNLTAKEKKYFVPDYYDVIDEVKTGCGNWIIHRKGMALLVRYLKNLYEDDERVRAMTVESHKFALERIGDLEEINKRIKEYMMDTRKDILWCISYTANILADMVLIKDKHVFACWV